MIYGDTTASLEYWTIAMHANQIPDKCYFQSFSFFYTEDKKILPSIV